MNGQLEVPFDKDRRRQSYELSQEHLMVNKVITFNCFFFEDRFVLLTKTIALLDLPDFITFHDQKMTDGTPLYFCLVENLVSNGACYA